MALPFHFKSLRRPASPRAEDLFHSLLRYPSLERTQKTQARPLGSPSGEEAVRRDHIQDV